MEVHTSIFFAFLQGRHDLRIPALVLGRRWWPPPAQENADGEHCKDEGRRVRTDRVSSRLAHLSLILLARQRIRLSGRFEVDGRFDIFLFACVNRADRSHERER
eukprot:3204466-Prymnesium_polylepis.1